MQAGGQELNVFAVSMSCEEVGEESVCVCIRVLLY